MQWDTWRIHDSAGSASVIFTGTEVQAKEYATSCAYADRKSASPATPYRYEALPMGGSPFDPTGDDEDQAAEPEAAAEDGAAWARRQIAAAHARQLAAQMTDWLTGHDAGENPLAGVPADVVEWCRAARDHLGGQA
jgi:hypothetical protein